MKTCPRCKLMNPPSTARCDCGYDFASRVDNPGVGETDSGVRYVVFQYCVSIIVMTFRRPSQIYKIGPEARPFLLGLRYTLVSLLFGWWGIPWGPIWTINSIYNNCCGGRDITQAILASRARRAS